MLVVENVSMQLQIKPSIVDVKILYLFSFRVQENMGTQKTSATFNGMVNA